MRTVREEIEDILVDCYGREEEITAWSVAFDDGVSVPFQATLLGVPVKVQGFQVSDSDAIQCLVVREQHKRWISVEDLDEENAPEDFRHIMMLYRAWLEGDY